MASIILALSLFMAAVAAPKADLWALWQPHQPDSEIVVDHSIWDAFLEKYRSERDGIAVLDYAAVSTADRQQLKDYLATLSQTAVAQLRRDEQRAFWINLYNALTVETILSHYPVDSIRDISPSLFSSGPWGEKSFSVAGTALSLDDIEHRILRPIWRDARLHYAVNCASIGCPNLAAEAYRADNSDNLLEAGARAYVNHSRGARVDNGQLQVSSIYRWFIDDFGGDDQGIIQHLRRYADEPLRQALESVESIAADDYDWSLNQR